MRNGNQIYSKKRMEKKVLNKNLNKKKIWSMLIVWFVYMLLKNKKIYL